MSPAPAEQHGTSRPPRPRSNTSFASLAPWRRNKNPDAASGSLSSTPAAPVQTLPIDTLLQYLTPPAVPSLSTARNLVTALQTQTPAPPPSTLMPILDSLCSTESPPALQSIGFDILNSYLLCGAMLSTSDRLAYFEMIRVSSDTWSPEVWEQRMKALNALLPTADDALGVEHALLQILSDWLEKSVVDLCANPNAGAQERQEKERAIEVVSDGLIGWFDKLEAAGWLSEDDTVFLFDLFRKLVDYTISVPFDQAAQHPSPSTPVRQNGSGVNTPTRHRRHQSSASNLTSPINNSTTPPQIRKNPTHLLVTIYLNFLDSRINRLPPSYLDALLPLLFRMLSTFMSPLPTLSPTASLSDRSPVEYRVVNAISALLSGPYTTNSTILLKRHLVPSLSEDEVKSSLGAMRMLRLQIRHVLEDRMAVRYVQRDVSATATHSGAPSSMGSIDEQVIFKRASRGWRKEGAAVWDARKISFLLVRSIKAWTALPSSPIINTAREQIFEDIAGLMKDVLHDLEDQGTLNSTPHNVDDQGASPNTLRDHNDTALAVGETLFELMSYVKTLRSSDGAPVILPLRNPMVAPTPFLRILAEVLSQGQDIIVLNPPLPVILLSAVDHLTDADSEKIPQILADQHLLYPTSADWLEYWDKLFSSEGLFVESRPLTRHAVMSALDTVFNFIIDIPMYRRKLAGLVFDFWTRLVQDANEGADGMVVWKLLGNEAVLRSIEDDIEELFTPKDENPPDTSNLTIQEILLTMVSVSSYCNCSEDDLFVAKPADPSPLSPSVPMTPSNTLASGPGSPIAPRTMSESVLPKDKENGNMQQQIMSLLSFAGSRHQSQAHVQQIGADEEPPTPATVLRVEASPQAMPSPDPSDVTCRGTVAVSALIDVFCDLSFGDSRMTERQAQLSVHIFGKLLNLLRTAQCPKVRIIILQLLMRLRADRDHRLYLKRDPAENESHIERLAQTIYRTRDCNGPPAQNDDTRSEEVVFERARPRQAFERDGRKLSRGRGSRTSADTTSRSRSRVAGHNNRPRRSTPAAARPRNPLWFVNDTVPFSVERSGKTSELLITYDPLGPDDNVVLPVSDLMDVLIEILKTERDWDVLSFVLVHLPAQLANKHFWCGPKCKESINNLLVQLCTSMSEGTLGKYIPLEDISVPSRVRDSQGLAYHMLTVLVSYQTIFDPKMQNVLVEMFLTGLSGRGDTVVVCLHALSLCAFEMESSIVKFLPRIMEKLSQIMSSPSMAVHILTFLSMVASLPHLYANFTENDFKMVFAVALQYLQHHNRPETLLEISFALAQHVRVISYYVVYVWFLALKLSERPRHIKFIARQLLLANEGREDVDDPTEVCFDWLARYTYASADPKPAPSLLSEILDNPAEGPSTSPDVAQEKSWVVGYSIVTVKLLAKSGWLEVVSRRASGTTKFLLKSENVPLVDLGDVDPDMLTIPAALMMDKDPRILLRTPSELSAPPEFDEFQKIFHSKDADEDAAPRPHPITGYVWEGSAPSQRRKEVDMDPSYLPLQLSTYPDIRNRVHRSKIVEDKKSLISTIRVLDRTPVIDTHKIGVLYVAPGQTDEVEILRNTYGSPAYTRFLEGLGRLIQIRGQQDVYTGGLEPEEDGEYAYAWWDDIGQILYHTATMMPTHPDDPHCTAKKSHIGNDSVRIIWNDSGLPYRFQTLSTQFQFVNIIIEPHSLGAIAAYSNNLHENEYFRLTVQCAEGMAEFSPVGDFKIVSAKTLPLLVRQISLVADWYASIFKDTSRDTVQEETITNWRSRLQTIKKFADSVPNSHEAYASDPGIVGQESFRDFTPGY